MAKKPKTAPTLETDRLRLRPFRPADLKALHALYGDPENLRYWGVDPSPSLDETRRMLRWHIAYHPFQYALWAVEEKAGRRVPSAAAWGSLPTRAVTVFPSGSVQVQCCSPPSSGSGVENTQSMTISSSLSGLNGLPAPLSLGFSSRSRKR